ncbi:MAG: sigma-54-dependent Fis family transcriptional regulator [Muribaculaceae bacterium]|nr:sigma-54-dependent Fis family transcriptional regulator [Muribaculaceae bacterium]
MAIPNEIQNVKRRFSIIGDSQALISAVGRAIRVAPHDLSVLVIGESGSGKEFFPKIIHENSPRRHGKYIAVNCGAIPEGTIDSELFGHVKGSFTGATSDHKGYFEEASGGTIFLDEVGEMPLSTQARLLRVLESGEFLKVGSSTVQKTNIRVVAATNKDMGKAVKDGKFREDLYYRLSTVLINVPPLRERGRDILMLTRKFMHDFADETHSPEVELTADAQQALMDYHWPGNVRQLKSVVQQVALFEAGETVNRETINQYLPNLGQPHLPATIDKSQFDYTQEREVIFMLIKQLQQEIDDVKVAVTGGDRNSATHVSANQADLKREVRQLGFLGRNDDSSTTIVHENHTGTTLHHSEPHDLGHVDEVNAYEVNQTGSGHIKTLDETERETIMEALYRNNGRRKKTAEELQISERTLYRKIKEYGLERR